MNLFLFVCFALFASIINDNPKGKRMVFSVVEFSNFIVMKEHFISSFYSYKITLVHKRASVGQKTCLFIHNIKAAA